MVAPTSGITMGTMYLLSKKYDGGVAVNRASGWQKDIRRDFAGEVIEAIFNDEDFDCESDMEICPDSENEENSDIGISEHL